MLVLLSRCQNLTAGPSGTWYLVWKFSRNGLKMRIGPNHDIFIVAGLHTMRYSP
jgi:hypothetical protein